MEFVCAARKVVLRAPKKISSAVQPSFREKLILSVN